MRDRSLPGSREFSVADFESRVTPCSLIVDPKIRLKGKQTNKQTKYHSI